MRRRRKATVRGLDTIQPYGVVSHRRSEYTVHLDTNASKVERREITSVVRGMEGMELVRDEGVDMISPPPSEFNLSIIE